MNLPARLQCPPPECVLVLVTWHDYDSSAAASLVGCFAPSIDIPKPSRLLGFPVPRVIALAPMHWWLDSLTCPRCHHACYASVRRERWHIYTTAMFPVACSPDHSYILYAYLDHLLSFFELVGKLETLVFLFSFFFFAFSFLLSEKIYPLVCDSFWSPIVLSSLVGSEDGSMRCSCR